MTDELVRAAARNNAEWCDLVCRSHGLTGAFHDGGWTVPRRSPPFYPDAVTLEPAADTDALLTAIDTSSGCSVKDSFASLDLAPNGFDLFFEAEWIARDAILPPPEAPADMRWDVVDDDQALEQWEQAWNEDGIPPGLFRPELLTDETVIILGGYEKEEIVAGAIGNRSATVIGISNVFSRTVELDAAWRGAIARAARVWNDLPLVGYEEGAALAAPKRVGFEPVGPLRVWMRGEPGDSFGPMAE